MNKHRLWLLAIILIAFALRLTLLGKQSLWYDEGVTWLLSQMSLPELIQWTAADIQPPLYYCLIWSTGLIFGDSEWALRFPSAFFNTLTVPLIYVLARQLFSRAPLPLRSPLAPVLATILFTLSPLMVYYSQEARMYTLLVFEATLASYLLFKILHSPTSRFASLLPTPYFPAYALTTIAALYTHYSAAFLLIAHVLYIMLILRQRRWPRILIVRLLLTFGMTTLLFAPWLSTLLSRLGDDPSYWPGALKLNEALRKVLISFTAGETVFEQSGWWLTLGYLAVLTIGGLWGLINKRVSTSTNRQTTNNTHSHLSSPVPPVPPGPPGPPVPPVPPVPSGVSGVSGASGVSGVSGVFILHPSSFLLLWLLLPLTLILLLSYQIPKFNPRYTILAYPAFILILTTTLTQLLKLPLAQRFTHHVSRIIPQRAQAFHASRFTLLLCCLLFILSTFTFSLYNWFTVRDFAKDDFKHLAKFVQEREAADETVLLSSGHMFPVWVYYYGWENSTPLPQMERLDVDRVTDLNIAGDIAKAIEGKGGVWLVSWQDEVIDPNGVVPFWLDLVGQRPVDAGDFWGVGLEHWRLVPDKIISLHETPIRQSPPETGYNFADQVNLLGMTQLNDTEIALFWRPHRSLPDDLILTLDLTDEAGFDWDQETAIGRPGAYFYPPSRWPVGQIVMTRHQLPRQIGTPPGSYTVEIGLGQIEPSTENFTGWDILDEQGRPQRRTALLGDVNLSQLILPEENVQPVDNPLVDFWPVVAVQRSTVTPPTAEPGDRILLTLLWQAGKANHTDLAIAFDLVDAADQTLPLGSYPTPSRDFNLSRWQPDDIVLGQYWLDIPPDAAPGPAILQLHLVNTADNPYAKVFPLDQLEILPTERNFTPPASVDIPLEAGFSGQATLLGADCSTWTGSSCQVVSGESVTLTLYWRADASLEKNYTIFTHLLGPDETVIVNADHTPPKPTQGWVTGEIIADPVTLAIPADLPSGNYPLEAGLYDAAGPAFERLPLTTGETRVMLPQPLTVK